MDPRYPLEVPDLVLRAKSLAAELGFDLRPEGSLVTAARTLFEHRGDVTVLEGDWREVMPGFGSFDLLFFDGGGRQALQPSNWAVISSMVKVEGIMILDDLTPEEQWPDEWRGRPDLKRELAFKSGAFMSTELPTSPTTSLLLMVRNGRSIDD